MKWLKRLAVTLLVLAAIAFVVPFLIPLNLYIPTLQNLASERLKEPVAIGSLSFALLPLPSVTVEEIAVGRQQDVKIQSVTVRPDVRSLFSKVKIIRAVEVSGVNVDRALLDRLPAWTKPEPGPKTVLVRRIEAHQVNLALESFKWGPLRAEVQLDEAGLQSVEAGTEDRRLTVNLVPDGEAYSVDIQGKHWPLPVKPAIEFDELSGKGTLTADSLDLSQLDGKLYGGELHAKSRIDWKGGIRIKGDARTVGVEIGPIVRMMSQSASLSGKLHANGSYSLGAKNARQLTGSLRAGFKFEVRQGVLYNFDLANAVRSLATEGTRGGQTSFNELSGRVNLVGKNTQLRDIKVASGILQANGNVDIAANKKLAGAVNVEMKGTASLLRVPLEVSGTLQDPVLFPNRAALAGAAVGTGLLGPGFGTGLGAKAGEALDSLFK
jgi:uncharacterized protein involved in outer membrane biogenesis